jgi:hypothetical protein
MLMRSAAKWSMPPGNHPIIKMENKSGTSLFENANATVQDWNHDVKVE